MKIRISRNQKFASSVTFDFKPISTPAMLRIKDQESNAKEVVSNNPKFQQESLFRKADGSIKERNSFQQSNTHSNVQNLRGSGSTTKKPFISGGLTMTTSVSPLRNMLNSPGTNNASLHIFGNENSNFNKAKILPCQINSPGAANLLPSSPMARKY